MKEREGGEKNEREREREREGQKRRERERERFDHSEDHRAKSPNIKTKERILGVEIKGFEKSSQERSVASLSFPSLSLLLLIFSLHLSALSFVDEKSHLGKDSPND